jgi:hypothetical protein
MTWEEKFNEFFKIKDGSINTTRFTYLMANDATSYGYGVKVGDENYPSLSSCLNAIKSGDLDTVKKFLEGHKNALDTLKKVKKLFDSYKGLKNEKAISIQIVLKMGF